MRFIFFKIILVGSLFLVTSSPSSKSKKSTTSFLSHIDFIEARAKTLLSETPNLTTSQGIANFVRYGYYAFNGATDEYEIQQGLGFLEVINNILGEDGIGGILGAKGYKSCSDIPTSGSSSGSISAYGQSMTIEYTFGSGIRKVPAHFPHDANASYDVSVKIIVPTGKYYVELKCSTGNVSTAYIYSSTTRDGRETINEAFYQKDADTKAVYVDFYLKDIGLNLVDINRFVTTDGVNFSLYHFNFGTSSNQGSAYAITGAANGKANVNAVTVSSLAGDVASKDIFSDLSTATDSGPQSIKISCIDMSTNSVATGCLSQATTPDLEIGTTTYDWTFDSIKSFTTSTSPF